MHAHVLALDDNLEQLMSRNWRLALSCDRAATLLEEVNEVDVGKLDLLFI